MSVIRAVIIRARYVEAAALDALGDHAAAARAFQRLLNDAPDASTRLKAPPPCAGSGGKQGQLERAIACAQTQLNT